MTMAQQSDLILNNKEKVLSFDPFMGDEGEYQAISNKIVKTLKEHWCNMCGQTVKKGTIARAEHGVYEGQIGTAYFCTACCVAMIKDTDTDDCRYTQKRYELSFNKQQQILCKQ